MTMDVPMADEELEGASWMGGRPGVGVSRETADWVGS